MTQKDIIETLIEVNYPGIRGDDFFGKFCRGGETIFFKAGGGTHQGGGNKISYMPKIKGGEIFPKPLYNVKTKTKKCYL